MKNGNIHQQLKAANREAIIAIQERSNLEAQMRREIKEAKKAIKAKYAPTLMPLRQAESDAIDKVWQYGKERHDYGRFNNYDMVHSMAAFMTYVEGERFVVHPINDAGENKVIMREEIALEYPDMDYETLMSFVESGDCVLLDEGYSNRTSLYNNIGEPNYHFGPYKYLREFVNRFVEYRKEKRKKGFMSMNDIFKYMAKFLASHPDLVQRNKESRDRLLLGYVDNKGEDLTGYGDELTKGCITLELLSRKRRK